MSGLLLVAGLLGSYAAGVSTGVGAVDDELTYLVTPWAGARWEQGAVWSRGGGVGRAVTDALVMLM